MKRKIANVLIALIKEECPSDKYFPIAEKSLREIALRNKVVPLLFHFIKCSNCQQKLNKKTLLKLKKQEKSSFILNLLYENKKRWINHSLRQKKIKTVFLKDFSLKNKTEAHQSYFWGADIDILIKKRGLERTKRFFLSNGYLVNKELPYEITFVNPKSPIEIDLHFLICEPHKNEFKFLSEERVNRFTQELLDESRLDKDGYYKPVGEYFLLSLIMHYWANDVLKGLRSFFEIIHFANFYDKQIDWKKFFNLAKQFQLINFSFFVFLLGNRLFDTPFPQGLKKLIKIPLRVSYPLSYYSVEKIAIFPKNGDWETKEGQKILKEHFFLQAIVNEKVPFLRLIRPQIILFLLKLKSSH